MVDVIQNIEKICNISICPLTYETLDPKYHSRNKIRLLENKSYYEQANNKCFTGLLRTRYIELLAKD